MYSSRVAEALRAAGLEVSTAAEFGLAGATDLEVFASAAVDDRTLLTENVADFTRISAEHLMTGRHHAGVLIALSSRFSRRAAGTGPLVTAILGVIDGELEDRIVYLQPPTKR